MFQKLMRGLKRTPRTQFVLFITAIILLGQEIFTICIYAMYKAQMFDGYAANGIFQLLDPMRRLYAGQTIGRNFNYFHGPFTMLLHYPIFLLFGHNLHGASMAEWLVSPLLILLVCFVFARIIFPGKLAYQLLAGWVVFRIIDWLVPALVSPSNSLLGVRLMGPVLIILAFWYSERIEKIRWRGLSLLWDGLIPFLVAFSLLTGTEFGLAAVGANLITRFFFQEGRWYVRVLGCARLFVWTLAYLILLAAILSKGAPFSILRYSFVDIPTDQFWYFGTPPNPFLINIGQMFKDKTFDWSLVMGAGLAAAVVYAHRRYTLSMQKRRTLTFLLIVAPLSLVPIFGYFFPPAQAQPMRFYLVMGAVLLISCLPAEFWYFCQQQLRRILTPYVRTSFLRQTAYITVGLVLAFIVVVRAYNETIRYHEHTDDMRLYHTVVSGSHLAEWWQRAYKAEVAGTAGLSGNNVWSLYVGLIDAAKGTFNPAGYDYIIHALGPARRAAYLNTFIRIKPASVITLRTPYFGYEPWLENEHWEFFDQLFHNYTPVTKSDMAFTWRKNNAPWQPFSNQWTSIKPILGPDQKQAVVKLPGGSAKRDFKLYTFEISYDATNKLGKLPYIGKMPRFLVGQSGLNAGPAVSLPPYDHSFNFPVLVRGSDKEVVFHFTTYSLAPGAHLQVKTLKWRQEDVSQKTLQGLYSDWVKVDGKEPGTS